MKKINRNDTFQSVIEDAKEVHALQKNYQAAVTELGDMSHPTCEELSFELEDCIRYAFHRWGDDFDVFLVYVDILDQIKVLERNIIGKALIAHHVMRFSPLRDFLDQSADYAAKADELETKRKEAFKKCSDAVDYISFYRAHGGKAYE